MGRALVRSTVGRVATAFALAITVMIATACGDSEPVTATTVTIKPPPLLRVNPDTKRPECPESTQIALGESASQDPRARATSGWGESTITVEALVNLHLEGALATEGHELHGLYNLTSGDPHDLKAGDTITLTAQRFTVSPNLAATMTRIDSVTLCVK